MRSRMSMAVCALLAVSSMVSGADLLRDDFDGSSLNFSNWSIGTWWLGRTNLGFTPQITGGMARLRLDTYNPANPGGSFKGTEILSNTAFGRGSGLEFEARVRVNALPAGLVTSFFTYTSRSSGGSVYADEIDFEFLSKQINASGSGSDPVLCTTWNDYNTNGSNFGDPNVHNSLNVNVGGLDLSQFNTVKIRWLPDRVQWYVNNAPIRTCYQAVPDEAAPIRANFWAPSSEWGDAYSSALQPTANPGLSQSWYYDVDYIAVRPMFSPVAASAPHRVLTDRFKNGVVANSDSISGYWTQRNNSAGSTVAESTSEPLKLTASGGGYPHAQVASAVRGDLNFFDTPIMLEATGIGFTSSSSSYSKSILRFVLSSQGLASNTDSEYTSEDCIALRIQGDNLITLGYKLNAANTNTEYNHLLATQTVSGPVRHITLTLHPTFYDLLVEHDASATDSTQVTNQFSGALDLSMIDWRPLAQSAVTGNSALYIQSQLNNSVSGESATALVDSLAVSAVRPEWSGNVSGNWTESAKWTGGVPNYKGAAARFTAPAGANPEITVNQAVKAGSLTFDSAASYLIKGGSTITLDRYLDDPAIAVVSGSHAISAPLALNRNTTIDVAAGSSLALSGSITASAGVAITKVGSGKATLSNARATALNVNEGTLEITPNGGAGGVSYMSQLAIAAGARLDLNDNDLVVEYGAGANPFSALRALVVAGYSSTPDPTKTGIVSSIGQSAGNTILALLDNALIGVSDWPIGSGHIINGNSVIGKYTYFGDANIDGQVTSDDYAILDSNLNTTPADGVAWLSGDANLDGSVTPDDYAILDSTLGSGVGNPLSAASAVPEPASVAFLIGALGLLRRRRFSRG